MAKKNEAEHAEEDIGEKKIAKVDHGRQGD